jgi:import inner membrane translocase subunit TIM8
MDSQSTAIGEGLDLSKLSMTDKQELQQFMINEGQKANIQSSLSSIPRPTYPHSLSFPS